MARASALALALCLASPAAGQTAPGAPAPCVPRDPVTAEINAREGIRLAKADQFAAAEALFSTAIRLDACTPKYPFLLGRAHERQDELDAAEAAYQSVIDRFPTSVEFTKAQGALIKLRVRQAEAARAAQEAERRAAAAEAARAEAARLEAARAAVVPPAPPPVVPPPNAGGRVAADEAPWGVLGWLSAGLGAVAIGAGVGFSLAALDADEELALAATRPDRARYDALVDDRDTFSTLGWVGYGVGAALVVGGLTLVLVDAGSTPAVAPTRGGAVVGFSGRF